MYEFALVSFILALLTGSPHPEQEGQDMKGEEMGRHCNVCQAATFSDAPEEDPSEGQLS